MNETDLLLDGYVDWLRSKISHKQLESWTEITTPFLDHHNDYIQIYMKNDTNGFLLSDGGETLSDLLHSGLDINKSPKRKNILDITLNGFGVKYQDGNLEIFADRHNFALRQHNLIQAILSVNDMFFLAASNVTSLFFEEVAEWLDEQDVSYSTSIHFTGKSGFDHGFDFLIPKPKNQPEIIIRAINNPIRTSAQNFIMALQDTENTRRKPINAFAILNDNQKPVSPKITTALRNYGIYPSLWSQRKDDLQRLTA